MQKPIIQLAEKLMAIADDTELAAAVATASQLLQEINDYCGTTNRVAARVRFPRGFIGTAYEYRQRLPGYLDAKKCSNCAYAFMSLDVMRWLAIRTDIGGVAKEMLIKSAVITLGTILEAVLIMPTTGILGASSHAGVKKRLEKSKDNGWLSPDDCKTLTELWDRRLNVHLRSITSYELGLYDTAHVNEPARALERFLKTLREGHTAGAIP